jgi:hypothetical protein
MLNYKMEREVTKTELTGRSPKEAKVHVGL